MASIHITPVKWDLAICVRNEIILGRMWGSLAGELQAAFLKEVVSDMGLCRMWRYIITLVSPRREGWCRVCRWLTLLPLPHVYSGEASDRACVTEDSEHPSSCQTFCMLAIVCTFQRQEMSYPSQSPSLQQNFFQQYLLPEILFIYSQNLIVYEAFHLGVIKSL